MALTIVDNATIAPRREEKPLIPPIIRAPRAALRECNDRAGLLPPILVVDVCGAFGYEAGHNCGLNNEDKILPVTILLISASKQL